jgi:type III restriction enzyme
MEDKHDGRPINIAMQEGEKSNFPMMCDETKKNVPIVLIIDESHTHADTEKSKRIRQQIIAPTYTILASATPTSNGDQIHKITYKEVARSGMIKKSIITQEFATYRDGVLSAAEQLQKLIVLAKETGVPFSPKMLLFVPNADKNGKNGKVEEILLLLKDKFNWDEKSGAIKLWVSGEGRSKNVEECKGNLNETRVIITKEALDTGVDIPSIQVIVQLRPNKNVRVQIQKIGRGLRMPEQRHYQNKLDALFFFTFTGFKEHVDWTDAKFLKEELDKSEITIRPRFAESLSKFPKIIGKHVERAISFIESEEDDFVSGFYPTFMEKVKVHIDGEGEKFILVKAFTQELNSFELNFDTKTVEKTGSKGHLASDSDTAIIYKHAMKEALKHTVKHLQCIEEVIEEAFDLHGKTMNEDRRVLILNNYELVCRLISETIRFCEQERVEKKTVDIPFAPPVSYRFNSVANDMYAGKNFLYDRYYTDRAGKKSDLERNFEEFLVNHKEVFWWSRNYDRAEGSLSVAYIRTENGTLGNFYPDNIIQLLDGRVFIVDSKGDKSDPNEVPKRDALVACLAGTNVIGGIVKDRDGNFYIDSGNGEESLNDLFEKKTQ